MRYARMVRIFDKLLFKGSCRFEVSRISLVGLRLGARDIKRSENLGLVIVGIARGQRLEGARAPLVESAQAG